ncbi:gliding motility-associated-like protein [Larkinella arboricola]|uniref:Gliding motility-associated-like protein n=2 Tax=Larkinella arboricola TaxID=643671 RepID=A0A327X361_LARAB|nr:gliding motility-associated-like protein [Larkinella arboricola]
MNLNAGLGGVVFKNNSLLTRATEKLTAVRHCNNQDFWVIMHEWRTDKFRSYLVNSNGLNSSYVETAIGTIDNKKGIGYLKASSDGKKLAQAFWEMGIFELYDFDNTTGKISNSRTLQSSDFRHAYGVEFSQDNKLLYVSVAEERTLYQLDITQTNVQQIADSKVLLFDARPLRVPKVGALQMGTDGKIYHALDEYGHLGIINQPSVKGLGCRYEPNGVSLSGKKSGIGLPNLITSYFIEPLTVTISTKSDALGCNDILLQASTADTSEYRYQWLKNNQAIAGAQSPTWKPTESGQYRLQIETKKCVPQQAESNTLDIKLLELNPASAMKTCSTFLLSANANSHVQWSGPGITTAQSTQDTVTVAVTTKTVYHVKTFSQTDPGCFIEKEITIEQQETPKITAITPSQPQCGDSNGTLIVSAAGGTGTLSYSLNGTDYKTVNQFDKLPGGEYTVTVKDQNQCLVAQTISLDKTVKLQMRELVVIPAACGKDNGSVQIKSYEGNGTLSYSIDGINYQPTGVFNNLKVGSYTASVKDQTGCTDSRTVTISSAERPKITQTTIQPATCGQANGKFTLQVTGTQPFQYELNGVAVSSLAEVANLAAGTYQVVVRDANFCQVDTSIVVAQQGAPTISKITAIDPSCGRPNGELSITAQGNPEPLQYSIDGNTFQTGSFFKNLPPGTYSILVKDPNGCLTQDQATLSPSSPPAIQQVDVLDTSCGKDNGSLTVTAQSRSGSLQYSIDSLVYQSSAAFNDLKAALYTVFVKDDKGCVVTSTAQIQASTAPQITQIWPEPTDCKVNTGRLFVRATGEGELSYTITGRAAQKDSIFKDLSQGTYEIEVRDNQNCWVRQTATVEESCQTFVRMPDAFTPNGDGTNDLLDVFTDSITDFELRIFNQWGEVIFVSNDPEQKWDGKYRGQAYPPMVYTYTVAYKSLNTPERPKVLKQGWIQLMR